MSKTVLVADDDAVTRKLLAKTLTSAGHHVVLASDGMRAYTILDDNPNVDLLITDVLMPGMDGRELVKKLRQDQRFSDLPMIIMSATVKISEIHRMLELGASRFLAKPVSPAHVRSEVEALLA